MSRRPARITQTEIDRALKSASRLGGGWGIEIDMQHGTIRPIECVPRIIEHVETIASEWPIHTFIYFVGVGDYVKIGFTKNIRRRLDTFATANPEALKLYYCMKGHREFESYLHGIFSEYRVEGTEWFTLGSGLRQWLEEHIAGDIAWGHPVFDPLPKRFGVAS